MCNSREFYIVPGMRYNGMPYQADVIRYHKNRTENKQEHEATIK